MLAVYIQYKILFQNVPNPAPKGFTETFQLTCWHMFFLIVGSIYPIQFFCCCNIYIWIQIWGIHVSCIYILVLDISYQQLGEMCQMEGLCAPWNHGMYNVHFVIYIFVLDICCQHLGNICQLEGFCSPFGRKVKDAQLSAPKMWTVGPRGPTVRGPTVRGPICLEPNSQQNQIVKYLANLAIWRHGGAWGIPEKSIESVD